ncbi:MAG: type II secretion system protein M [Alteromonadaceae bacterium]|nr:type II secretion system protein M [Alteromonadaceae bacterium]
MNKLRQWYENGAAWYNDRPVRERALIALTAIVLVFVVSWELLVAPALSERQQLESQRQSLADTRDNLLAEQQTLSSQLENDPSAQLRDRLQVRQNRLDRLNRQISETAGELIAPKDMVSLLRRILAEQDELTLQSLVLRPPTPVFDEPRGAESEQQEESQPEPLLYAHDVELTIAGGYLDVMNYLEKLETLDDRLGWLQLEYNAGTWPEGEARVRVRTLSLEAAWLGV